MFMETGIITEIFLEDGLAKARVEMERTCRIVTLVLLLDARVGDEVTIAENVALARIGEEEPVV
jgi:hypothetical protein